MRVLFLAPHPFYQDRGTPIDVLLVLKVLSGRGDTVVDVVTFHEGSDVELENVSIRRIRAPRLLRGIRPGFSMKKLACDVLLFFMAWRMVRTGGYDFIHADEESVFFAMFFKWFHGIPYAYDLDSSIAQQLVESRPALAPLSAMFGYLETRAIRGALINLPVCVELGRLCESAGSRNTIVLHDISQLDGQPSGGIDLKGQLGIAGTLLLYAGNFEAYQGIELLIDGFRLAVKECSDLYLAFVGGNDDDIRRYSERSAALGLVANVFFLGRKPIRELGAYLRGADIVVSPRVRGINTPMKTFAYLHSGRPLIATDIVTHNQVLSKEHAMLVPPNPEGIADGIVKLARDPELRQRLAERGRALVEANHTFDSHRKRVNRAYDWIESQLRGSREDREQRELEESR